MKRYLSELFPVIEDIAGYNTQFFNWTDSMGYPENSVLENRAKKHIEEFRNHSLMKIPFQNYGK